MVSHFLSHPVHSIDYGLNHVVVMMIDHIMQDAVFSKKGNHVGLNTLEQSKAICKPTVPADPYRIPTGCRSHTPAPSSLCLQAVVAKYERHSILCYMIYLHYYFMV